MSVSSLPEWKQLLLEKKRREEEERGRREKEEEEKLASMPAWKRGIIQRRKAKQETLGDREKERDVCLLQVDVRSSSDGLSDTDSSVTVNMGSELSISPDPGQWLDADPKPQSQVSVETIVPLHENPFIRTQSARRKGKDADIGSDPQVNEREKEKPSPRSQDVEVGVGRDIELKIEIFKDFSEGREKDRSRERGQGRERENSKEIWEKDINQLKDSGKDAIKERECLRVIKDEEEKETDPPSVSFSPIMPCLQTIRADNIIIIEQDRKGSDERRNRWKEVERERPEDDHQGKRGMKMDLREILAGGVSVTEIRASEVLIIKPPVSPEERNTGGKGREDGEMKCITDARRESMGREFKKDMSWLREKEKEAVKEKERPWGQATVIKDDRKDSLDDNVFVERGGRVSQLLSKFGEHPKPPSRSKSSDNFLQPGRRKYSGDQDDQQSEERKADGRSLLMKGVPKRSFSFSDRVISAEENGLDDKGSYERKTRQRIHSDKSMALWGNVEGLGKVKLGCTQSLDTDRFVKRIDGYSKNKEEKLVNVQMGNEADKHIIVQHRGEGKEVEPVDKRAPEMPGDADGDEGFTVASVKNTEGISFARRVPIRQDGKVRAEREVKRLAGERTLERELSMEKDSEAEGQIEATFCNKAPDFWQDEGFERATPAEAVPNFVTVASEDTVSPCHAAESPNKHESTFTESSGLLCTVTDRARGSRGPYPTHSVLSQHTEELISKIEKIGDTTVYSNDKGQRSYRGAYEITTECKQEGHYSDVSSDTLSHDVTARSQKRIAPTGIPPLEIQIPRTVFYVAEEVVERKNAPHEGAEGQNWEGGQGVDRRDSWRVGKPLSRIESLQEKIRQRELERLRQRQTQDGSGSEVAEISDIQAAGDRYDEGGTEIENEWEAAAHMRKKQHMVEADRAQEDTQVQTSTAAFDVKQEVSVLKTCPQLPVSVPHLQAVIAEEVTSGYGTAASEVISGSSQTSEDENNSLKHAEEQLKFRRDSSESREEERVEENKELSEEEVKAFTSPDDLSKSLSPSPPHPSSLTAMSRIYNLETVGSRSGLCLRQRNVDISPVHLAKVKPLISNAQQGDSSDDFCGVQAIQRQIEQFQLKDQEPLKSCSSPNTSLKDRETKGQQSPRGLSKYQVKDDVKTQEKDQEKTETNSKLSPQRVCSPTSQLKQTITITSLHLRGQPPDNSQKSTVCAPTPASSPSTPSPAPSPSVSPSPTPSPVPFSIRSASGGQVKRGATITITPKRPAAADGAKGGPTAGSKSAGSTPSKATSPSQQTQTSPTTPTTPTAADPAKKRFPTAEEIEVIGGYQNLEKSCLVKNRVTPKKVKVCFDEEQLEQVCEYPSEMSMLASNPYPHDLGKVESRRGEEAQEEDDEVEAAAIVSKSTKNAGMPSRGLRRILAPNRSQSPSPNLPM
ncbi:hypothetical protein Q5P01_018483 [Channa striata]|uniref:Phostensin/Taperin PP1-binding domain-containing protein n=1 Tax=Channa striata TaxID=64152 RepID=A0AA88M5W8_CHASR|nr:hypothetical protein Q5P01_018483 [Channa striata]